MARQREDVARCVQKESNSATVRKLEALKFTTGREPVDDSLVRTGLYPALEQQAIVCDLEECRRETWVTNPVTDAPREHWPT